MKVALYARFSSEKQDAELSIGAQLKALSEYADKQDFEHSDNHIYVDEARSALSDNRPEFKRMIANAKKNPRPFDAILVWKLSRFARSRRDSIVYKSLLKSLGIDVISINEPLDDSPAGQLLEGIIEVLDEFYSTNLAQDTLRGMTENAKRGFFNGGTAPMGYSREKIKDGAVERTKLVPDPSYAPIIKRIFEMSYSGSSLKAIAQKLNSEGITTKLGKKWSTTTVRNILANEIYTGTFVWNKKSKDVGENYIRIEGTHQPIIEKSLFESVQRILRDKRKNRTSIQDDSSHYLLSGILTCGKCKGKLTGYSSKSHGKTYYYYACCTSLRQGKDQCDFKIIPQDKLESFVLQCIQNDLLNTELISNFTSSTNEKIASSHRKLEEELNSIQSRLKSLNGRLSRLYDALESGKMEAEDIGPRIKELRVSIKQAETKKEQMEDALSDLEAEIVDSDMITFYLEHLKEALNEVSNERKKFFLKACVKGITIYPDHIEIKTKIPTREPASVLSDRCSFSDYREEWLLGLDSNQQPPG